MAVIGVEFRNGLNVRVSLGHLDRFLHSRLVNPLEAEHYRALTSYADPRRAAAAVLHAHHVSTEDTLALRALDAEPDGTIPCLGTTIAPGARPILAAQRWLELITGDENPPLIDKNVNATRAGIRKGTNELGLSPATNREILRSDRWQHNYGLRLVPIT